MIFLFIYIGIGLLIAYLSVTTNSIKLAFDNEIKAHGDSVLYMLFLALVVDLLIIFGWPVFLFKAIKPRKDK